MSEILKIAVGSIVQQKGSHAASAATISAGVTAKIVESDAVTLMDQVVSVFGDAAVIIAPVFTLFLFYKAWRADRREQQAAASEEETRQLDRNLRKLMIAKESRREADK